jgi:3-hydroxyacyl-CoA dehydrogenase
MPTVGIIGTGLIGRAWANVFARGGWDVRLWDPDRDALAKAPGLIAEALQDVARHGLATDPAAAAKRIGTRPATPRCAHEAGSACRGRT